MNNNDAERREYFRIKDLVKISLQKIDDKGTIDKLRQSHSSFLLGSAINAIEIENQTLFNAIKRNNSGVAQYLEAINKKIELISNHLLESSSDNVNQIEMEVNLSASGIAIETNDAYSEGEVVAINLLLLPERKGIICTGIIKRILNENNMKTLCIDFDDIIESDRELIIKHTISRQLEQARKNNDLYD